MIMENYARMHRYHNKLDGSLALGLFAVNVLLFYLTGFLYRHHMSRIFVPVSIAISIAVVALVLIRRQKMGTLGISAKGLHKSALLGLVTGAGYFFFMRVILTASVFERAFGGVEVIRRMGGDRFFLIDYTPFMEWFPMALVFVIVTVIHQELVFRGYIQTRLAGLVKNEIVATVLTAIMFAVMFIPMHSLMMGESIGWVFMAGIHTRFILTLCLHMWLHFLYRLYNNIAAPMVFMLFFTFHMNDALVHAWYLWVL